MAADPPPSGYAATSERVSVDEYQAHDEDYLIYVLHTATYDYAARQLAGLRVLDFGCGTGYGDERIADRCLHVTGVDVSHEAIAYAVDRHRHERTAYRRIDPVDDAPLPFGDASFDAVLSFQVIEHVSNPAAYLSEAARVTRPGGLLILATPDRRSRLWPGQRPWNRYHLTEFEPTGLAALLTPWYDLVESAGMGARHDVLQRELARTRRLRTLSAPFTFPGAPERLRQAGLGGLKALQRRRRTEGTAAPAGTMGDAVAEASTADRAFDEGDIVISPGVLPSMNIVMTARRR